MYPAATQIYTYCHPLSLHVALPIFGDLVSIATGVEEWEAAIARLLQPGADAAERRVARQAEARRHGWNVIVERIARELVRRLDLPEDRKSTRLNSSH